MGPPSRGPLCDFAMSVNSPHMSAEWMSRMLSWVPQSSRSAFHHFLPVAKATATGHATALQLCTCVVGRALRRRGSGELNTSNGHVTGIGTADCGMAGHNGEHGRRSNGSKAGRQS